MDIEALQNDVIHFLSQNPHRRFRKGEIATGVAALRRSAERLTFSETEEADAIYCVLKEYRLRNWPKIEYSGYT